MRADNYRVSRNGNECSSPNGGQSRKSRRSSFFIVSVRNSNVAHCELFVRGCRWFYYFLPFQTLPVHFTLQMLMMESTSQKLLGRPENLPRPPV